MTFLEKIKHHLISDDFIIQQTVLYAIHDYPDIPEDWTVLLLKEAFKNDEKQNSIFVYIDHEEMNEEAVKILLENIPTMDKENIHLAINLFDNVEPKLALKYRNQLETYLSSDMWDLYELLINGTEEEVYTEYGNTLHSLEQGSSFQHNLYIKAKKLATCIVRNGWITEDEIGAVINEEMKEDSFSLNGIMNVYMLGLLKIEKYIPTLASLLDCDDDMLLEEVSQALIGFQSNKVVEAVAPYLKHSETLIYSASVLENIKTDLAVQVLRNAYNKAKELDDQDILFEALCHQLSEDAITEISAHMSKEYFSGLIEVEQAAYGYFAILGLQHPDLELWKSVAMDVEMQFRKNNDQKSFASNIPVRNDNKIGRNAPCPCGSGKKFKKCCGK